MKKTGMYRCIGGTYEERAMALLMHYAGIDDNVTVEVSCGSGAFADEGTDVVMMDGDFVMVSFDSTNHVFKIDEARDILARCNSTSSKFNMAPPEELQDLIMAIDNCLGQFDRAPPEGNEEAEPKIICQGTRSVN